MSQPNTNDMEGNNQWIRWNIYTAQKINMEYFLGFYVNTVP